MKEYDLTFGIPLYNSEKYIEELLNCFFLSRDFNYEIIIIDDGSTDNGYDICKKISIEKPELNIKVLKQENNGVSYTRNRIIDESSSIWITFIDSDDLIDFDKYSIEFHKIKDSKLEFYINTYNTKNFNKLRRIKEKLPYLISKEIINRPCTKFYKVDKLKENNLKFPTKIDLGEDLIFNLYCYNKLDEIEFFCSDMYKYRRINTNSLTLQKRDNKLEKLMELNFLCSKMIIHSDKNLKAIEFIRIKNCLSCILKNTETKFYEKITIIKKMRNIKRKYIFLNNFYETYIYNIWYMFPCCMIAFLGYFSKSKGRC